MSDDTVLCEAENVISVKDSLGCGDEMSRQTAFTPPFIPPKTFGERGRNIKAMDLIHNHSANLVFGTLKSRLKSPLKFSESRQNKYDVLKHCHTAWACHGEGSSFRILMLHLMDVRTTISNAVGADKQETTWSSCIFALPVPQTLREILQSVSAKST